MAAANETYDISATSLADELERRGLTTALDDLAEDGPSAFKNPAKVIEYVMLSLQHAADEMRDDPDLVLAAIRSIDSAFAFASDRLCRDPYFVLSAVRLQGSAIIFAAVDLAGDRTFILRAVAENQAAFQFSRFSHEGLRHYWSGYDTIPGPHYNCNADLSIFHEAIVIRMLPRLVPGFSGDQIRRSKKAMVLREVRAFLYDAQ